MTITDQEISGLRLLNQRISLPSFANPGDVVDWLCAVQAQDYFGAKWALGLRMRDATDDAINTDFNVGSILRTHLLRPTWHFVSPADIRWLLTLTAPRVHAVNGSMYRKLGLDKVTFKRSNDVLGKALQGGKHLTRDELKDALEHSGIDTVSGLRMSYFMMYAELEGIVCSGPRRGKQFTYALLEERAPQARNLGRKQALAELSRRFFASRGPATDQDFAKWSGLTLSEARDGLDAVKNGFERETRDGNAYWFLRPRVPLISDSSAAYLLSVYDEYISSYKDRSAINAHHLAELFSGMGNALQYVVILDGQLVGTWKRMLKKDSVIVKVSLFTDIPEAGRQAIMQAAQQYSLFLGLQLDIQFQ